MPAKLRVSNEALLTAYAQHGSVWKTAEAVGICGQSVHERLVKLGVARKNPAFSEVDKARLKAEYLIYRDAGKLADLAANMGRTKHLICREARELGLTDPTHEKRYFAVWKYMSKDTARVLFEAFRESSYGLGRWCKAKGYDDLGFSRTMMKFFPDEYDILIESKAPSSGLYKRGREFEYRTRDFLRKAGYFVLRSPKSGSPTDLIAMRTGEVLFVQCKRNGALGVREWNDLFDLAGSVSATPLLARISDAGRGITFHRLDGRKDGSKRRQPMSPWAASAVG